VVISFNQPIHMEGIKPPEDQNLEIKYLKGYD
jgi:hypothetical protein